MSAENHIHLEFFTAERAYSLSMEPDLFGDLHLTRRWWGRQTGRGNSKVELVADRTSGLKRLNSEVKRRAAHRYTCVNSADLAQLSLPADGVAV